MSRPDDDRPAGTAPPAETGQAQDGPARHVEEHGGEGGHGRRSGELPHSRTGTLWVGICVTVLVLGLLIVFIAQNTETVDVTFLWMNGTVPLAVALLIAAAGAGLLATIVGTIRIAQLRRFHRKS
ncbi:lipopolysaccharide assembly protein LapA domain-containing protein [Jiangella endophytica]|uniref:lipopolysaccharide assembly protein LapA domain-containing protein n=1 Tax=Jiangella endophytica TaxID=1623398 RepID=UPI000E34594C|nr:lipopolysaccharide assembly protein LapA domain-containing protein [Jiangella endophytica]